jgi:aromatic ring-opening dioxygenase catalytic subunit (LigB family)
LELRPLVSDQEKRVLTDYLEGIVASLPRPPPAVLVVSAHWEAKVATVSTRPQPPMFYDDYGFPPHT